MVMNYPKSGRKFKVGGNIYKWKFYKPDGARQMGCNGRFQKMQWSGDFFKWVNESPPKDYKWEFL